MSEESSTDTPADDAPEGEPTHPRRRRPQRSTLILGAAAVISVAAIAAALVIAVQPAAKQLEYTRLPAPCAMVSKATLARYLPNPTGTPESTPTYGTVKGAFCKWSSSADGEDRTLMAQVFLFSSSTAITAAQQSYNVSLSNFGCHRCKGISVSTRPVSGLGDRAAAVFITASPGANELQVPDMVWPGVNLLVVSRNAFIFLGYNITASATGTSLAAPADTAQLAGMIAMTRGILATLARPAAASAARTAIAAVSSEPHYAGRIDPCRLITATTLATYAPAALVTPAPGASASGSTSGCTWGSSGSSIMLQLTVFPDAVSALQSFLTDDQGAITSTAGITVTGDQAITDLGEQAAVIFQTRSGADGVQLLVWSGNAELNYWYGANSGSPPPDRGTLLTGVIAMARDSLALLARPGAAAFPQQPLYAVPNDPCALIKASTLATYLPGATVGPTYGNLPQEVSCNWGGSSASLSMFVTIDTDPDSAQGEFRFDVQFAQKNQNGYKFIAARSVKGLGEQATAVFQTLVGSPGVELYVWSGNAVIELNLSDFPFSPQDRAALLASSTAMARDVLRDLPPGKPPAS